MQLDGSESRDADEDVLSFQWTAPAGITLSSATNMQPRFNALQEGTYTFSLVVNDGQEHSVPDEVVIRIAAPPLATGEVEVVGQFEGIEEGRIAFVSDRDSFSGESGIYTMLGDGTGVVGLGTGNGNVGEFAFPNWSPDRTAIAFGAPYDGDWEIYLIATDGSDQLQMLTNNGATDVLPAWSPDGTRIAFASNRDGDWEIYVMEAGKAFKLTDNSAGDLGPSWSPDGTRIAFQSDRDGDYEIYVTEAPGFIPATGSTLIRLTRNSWQDDAPSWSPDGTRIAFASDQDGDWEVNVMDADGGNLRQLTHNEAEDGVPSWSPDGTKIAFESDRDGNFEIYLMSVDSNNQISGKPTELPDRNLSGSALDAGLIRGVTQVNLTNNPAADRTPSWSTR